MLVDSHCHLNFPELSAQLPELLKEMHDNNVAYALAVSVSHQTFVEVKALAEDYPQLFATVGLHPSHQDEHEFSREELITYAQHPKVVAIGETGLDYHWCKGDLSWQHQRFITHIEAARASDLPLVVHTREAAADTLRLLREQGANKGVIHCFTEDTAFARAALDLGFYISFSGVVTFKNAAAIQEACRYIPADRLLVETDAPYLAPMPYRGKLNRPAYVRHTAEFVAQLRQESFETVADTTTDNFFRLFDKAVRT